MIQHYLLLWLPCILILTSGSTAFGQIEFSQNFPEISITMTKKQFNRVQISRGAKIKLNDAIMTINGDSARIKDLHLRGNNTLYFTRKSFSVTLDKSLDVTISKQNINLKKFHLLNLAMDKNIWHNRWSFLIMSQLGIFPPFNTYCTIKINGQSQGIYLLVEKPQHAASAMNSPYIIRRGLDHAIDHEYTDIDSKEELINYRKQYQSLYQTNKLTDTALYEHISKALNTEHYFKWVGFNYFIMNGDYSDELFLYINPTTKVFEVIAWDYDDIFMANPHEGKEVRSKAFTDHMIFSFEDSFDKTIASDDFVYSKYLNVMKELLSDTDSAQLTTAFQKILDELVQLSNNPENCSTTLYLDQIPFDIEDAEYDIQKSMNYLLSHRSIILKKLENIH